MEMQCLAIVVSAYAKGGGNFAVADRTEVGQICDMGENVRMLAFGKRVKFCIDLPAV